MSIPEITFGHSLLTSRTLYVSDLDGTLLNSHSIVSDASARMLNTAIASGAHFTVATARTPATAIHLLSEIDMRLPRRGHDRRGSVRFFLVTVLKTTIPTGR